MTRIVAISDTHGMHRRLQIPDGDILIHAGDFCDRGEIHEVQDFANWLSTLPHKHKVITAGNHDTFVALQPHAARHIFAEADVTLLLNQHATVEGLKIWCSPIAPRFGSWPFMVERGNIDAVWHLIPEDVDVLVTHGPPYGHGDRVISRVTGVPRSVGCLGLLTKLKEMMSSPDRLRPLLHVFGHIHEGYGQTISDEIVNTTFINAATCTDNYVPSNRPIVLDTITTKTI